MRKEKEITLEIHEVLPSILLSDSCDVIIYLKPITPDCNYIYSDLAWFDIESQSFRNHIDNSRIFDPSENIIVGWSILPFIDSSLKLKLLL